MVARVHGHGLLALGVRAGAGLGERKGAQPLAAREIGQVLRLLLLGAEGKDRVQAQGVHGQDDAGGGALLGELLDAHCVGKDIATLSAVLLRDRNAHKTIPAHLLHSLDREFLCLIYFLSQRFDFVFGKLLE